LWPDQVLDPRSGTTPARFRLDRYADRQLNRALHTIMLSRPRCDPAPQDYAKRRTAQGKTPTQIKRRLKRNIARDLYRLLEHPSAA
jgi:transposase